jgi:hypothetical protein
MTGDVFNEAPIANRQELARTLWEEMGRVKTSHGYQPVFEESESDEAIIERALKAVNGDKFKKLLEGQWPDVYPSQSEADFAFVDMIAFYTQSRNQITRIFRNSDLGKRDKAQRSDYVEYMLNKAFDRILPPIDIEGLANGLTEAIARKSACESVLASEAAHGATAGQEASASDSSNEIALRPAASPEPSPYTLPPGLLGEVAAFIYQAAPRQVPEIALAAAIALMAGITGRAYNVSGTGLNQYVLLLSQTGNGKEAMASGIDKLIMSIKDEVPSVKEFIGPSEIASGQALLKYLSKTSHSFVSIIGEFGLKMQTLADQHANAADKMLKRMLLDLFNKSGNGRIVQPSIYSQKENNTDPILAPAVTLLGESTPDTFYGGVDETIIADGLLPRFTLIEYNGKRPPLNPTHGEAQPSESLRNGFANLIAYCLKLNNGINSNPIAVNVRFTTEAATALDDFNVYADEQINGTNVDVIRHLWNRAHIKALKLSALVAVGINPFDPCIDLDAANWAMRIVRHDVSRLFDRFQSGDFGKATEETKQAHEVRRVIKDYVLKPIGDLKAYTHNEKMHADKVIPYAYINKRLAAVAAFRLDRNGASNAMKRVIQMLIDSGLVAEIGKLQMQKDYETTQKAYAILDKYWLTKNE